MEVVLIELVFDAWGTRAKLDEEDDARNAVSLIPPTTFIVVIVIVIVMVFPSVPPLPKAKVDNGEADEKNNAADEGEECELTAPLSPSRLIVVVSLNATTQDTAQGQGLAPVPVPILPLPLLLPFTAGEEVEVEVVEGVVVEVVNLPTARIPATLTRA